MIATRLLPARSVPKPLQQSHLTDHGELWTVIEDHFNILVNTPAIWHSTISLKSKSLASCLLFILA